MPKETKKYHETEDIINNWETHWSKRNKELDEWNIIINNIPYIWEIEFNNIVNQYLRPIHQIIANIKKEGKWNEVSEPNKVFLEKQKNLALAKLSKMAKNEIRWNKELTEKQQEEQVEIFNSILYVQQEQVAQIQINSLLESSSSNQ